MSTAFSLNHSMAALNGVASIKPVQTSPRFGHFCGICPLCVAGMAAKAEVDKIRQLRTGDDIEIQTSQAFDQIRQAGETKGVRVMKNSVGNADGSRFQPVYLGTSDTQLLTLAALPRRFSTNGSYKIDTRDDSGLQHKQFSFITGHVEESNRLIDYPAGSDDAPPTLQDPSISEVIKQTAETPWFKTMALYHHLSEGMKSTEETGRSAPLFIGYSTFGQLQSDDLFIPSVRELPGFEHMAADIGSLQNLLGLAARKQSLKTVTVAVEPWQQDVLTYLKHLQSSNTLEVTEQTADPESTSKSGYQPMAQNLQSFLREHQYPMDTRVFTLDLAKIREMDQSLKAKQTDETSDGDLDTKLLESFEPQKLETDIPENSLLGTLPKPGSLTLGKKLKKTS
ncbi:MAG: hypothetical protein KTR14_01465 [Vampirovibrio sp.]|nr:hypothetical protein [Vampirovibrio sp.]